MIRDTSLVALFLVKPDALAKREDDYARNRIAQEGLCILREQEVRFTEEITRNFYYDKRDEKFAALADYITAGRSLAIVVCGDDCYRKLFNLKQEMRKIFNHGDVNTGTHSSDDLESALREIDLLGIKYP